MTNYLTIHAATRFTWQGSQNQPTITKLPLTIMRIQARSWTSSYLTHMSCLFVVSFSVVIMCTIPV